eukprot:SAG11_NODE_21087_length_432_cov_1.198198_1_plen_72_part_10
MYQDDVRWSLDDAAARKVVQQILRKYDRAGTHSIAADDVAQFKDELGDHVAEDQIQRILEFLDTNSDGRVST